MCEHLAHGGQVVMCWGTAQAALSEWLGAEPPLPVAGETITLSVGGAVAATQSSAGTSGPNSYRASLDGSGVGGSGTGGGVTGGGVLESA